VGLRKWENWGLCEFAKIEKSFSVELSLGVKGSRLGKCRFSLWIAERFEKSLDVILGVDKLVRYLLITVVTSELVQLK
jgi:hypothetical protein